MHELRWEIMNTDAETPIGWGRREGWGEEGKDNNT